MMQVRIWSEEDHPVLRREHLSRLAKTNFQLPFGHSMLLAIKSRKGSKRWKLSDLRFENHPLRAIDLSKEGAIT